MSLKLLRTLLHFYVAKGTVTETICGILYLGITLFYSGELNVNDFAFDDWSFYLNGGDIVDKLWILIAIKEIKQYFHGEDNNRLYHLDLIEIT